MSGLQNLYTIIFNVSLAESNIFSIPLKDESGA